MTARDRWVVPLKCRKCGKTGEARVSEDDYAFRRDLDFDIDEVPPGFRVKSVGRNNSSSEIVCTDCNELANV